jgi:SNF2 family DNA or RNA helicase
MLPRQPLRFLLADDPGAGKTIMAGLFIKELMIRGDVERCLVVAPGGLVEQWQDELYEKFGLPSARCTEEGDAKEGPVPTVGQAMRTAFGRPRSSMRLRTWAAIATSVAWAPSLWERSASLMTRFQRPIWPSTLAL